MREIALVDLSKQKGWSGKKRWQVRWPDPSNPRGRTKGFELKRDAQAFRQKLEQGDLPSDEPKTKAFDVLAEEWIATRVKRVGRKPNTDRVYDSKMRTHLIPYFGSTPQNTIDHQAVEDFIVWMGTATERLPTGQAPKTIRDTVSVLSGIMKFAIKKNLRRSGDNPALGHEIEVPPPEKIKPGDDEVMTMAQAKALAAYIRNGYAPLWWVLVYTGVRPAEVCGFCIRHLDVERRCLYVAETLNYIHGHAGIPAGVHRGPPKSDSGYRNVFVPAWLVEDLVAMLDRRAILLGRLLGPDDPLFVSVARGPLTAPKIRRTILRPALAAAGMDPAFRTYDARHSAATIWIDNGIRMEKIDRLMGQRPGSGLAARRYWHPGDDELREGAEVMDREHDRLKVDHENVIDLGSRRSGSSE